MPRTFPDVEAASEAAVATLRELGAPPPSLGAPPLIPDHLVALLHPESDVMFVTGFEPEHLAPIIAAALQHLPPVRGDAATGTECVFLAIAWLRSGLRFAELGEMLTWNAQRLQRAVLRGIHGLACSFGEFRPLGGAPRLDASLSPEERGALPPDACASQFIVDGRHVPCARVGDDATRQAFYSYKLNCAGLQYQCVHVAAGARARTHDLSVWVESRARVMARLREIVGGDPLILADKGYRKAGCPELVACKGSDASFNKHRIIIECYFGRMSKVFAASSKRFTLALDRFDVCVKALCHLTNMSIAISL
jgi:hypothetical protein